jgi:hypothetical protein
VMLVISQHSPHASPNTPPYEPPAHGSAMARVNPARTDAGSIGAVRSNSHQPPFAAVYDVQRTLPQFALGAGAASVTSGPDDFDEQATEATARATVQRMAREYDDSLARQP